MQDEIDAFLGLERKVNIPANVPANVDANVPANVDAIVEEKNEQKTTNYRDILAKLQEEIQQENFESDKILQLCSNLLKNATQISTSYDAIVTVLQRTKKFAFALLELIAKSSHQKQAIDEKNIAILYEQLFKTENVEIKQSGKLKNLKTKMFKIIGEDVLKSTLSNEEINQMIIFTQFLHIPFTVQRLARELRQTSLQVHLKKILEMLEFLLSVHPIGFSVEEAVNFLSAIVDAFFVNISLNRELQQVVARIEVQLSSLQDCVEEQIRFEELLKSNKKIIAQAKSNALEQVKSQLQLQKWFV